MILLSSSCGGWFPYVLLCTLAARGLFAKFVYTLWRPHFLFDVFANVKEAFKPVVDRP
jgi:hypothetical protein